MPDRSVVYSFIGNFSSLNAGLATASRNTTELGTKLTALDRNGAKMRAGLDTLGRSAGRVGLVAAGGLALATKAAIDWESQWAGVMKTVDGTAAQMDSLENSLRELARTMPATHEEIAATAEAAGQLGVAREDIVDFTKVMLQLGETTNLSADEAATSIAQFMNVLGTTGDQVDEIGNTLVALGNKGASTEAQILGMAQRLSGAGKLIGASEADVLGLASAMANLGIEAELGGGSMSRVIAIMQTAVADGGEALKGFSDVAGVSAKQFAEQWETDPVMAIDAFLQGLNGIDAAGGNIITTMADLGIKGTQNRDVMLRLAGAGDELTTSLDNSAEAWGENSALTQEYGKRAETTAAEVQVAWNNIKDAAIEVGAAVLPIVGQIAEATGDVAQAFGELPGPVKSATGGLLGITAILGGGLWFTSKTVSGIANTKQALSDLGITSNRTSGSLGRLARTAGGIAAVAGAVTVLGNALADATGAKIDASDLQRDLEAVANGQNADLIKRMSDDLDILGHVSNKTAEPLHEVLTAFGLFGNTAMDNASDNINSVDEALAGMVESGNAEMAAEAFAEIASAITGLPEGSSFSPDFIDGFDSYATALDNAAAASDEATDAQKDLGPAAKDAAGGMAQAAAAAEKAAEKLKKSKDAARETARGFIGLGDSLDNGKKSLAEWMHELEQQAQALRNFTKNAQTAAKKGLDDGLIKSLNEAGPAGALRMKQLANATDGELKRANKAWREGQAAIREYVNMTVPPKKVQVDNRQALDAIATVQARLASLHSKTIAIDIATGTKRAGGGPIYGPGSKTSDSVPVMASRGEFMMSAAAVDHYGVDTMFAMNARHLAAGGPTSGYASHGAGGTPDFGLGVSADHLAAILGGLGNLGEKELHRRERQLEKLERLAEKGYDAAKERLDEERAALKDLRDARREFMSSVTGNFRTDVFGGDLDLTQAALGGQLGSAFSQGLSQWMQANGVQLGIGASQSEQSDVVQQYLATLSPQQLAALQAQASVGQINQNSADATAFEQVLQQLQDMGLTGGAYAGLAASGNLAQAQAYLAMGPEFIQSLMQDFRRRNEALRNLGQSVGNAQFGADIRDQLQETRQANRIAGESRDSLRAIEHAQRGIEQRLDRIERDAPRKIGKETAGALDSAAAASQRGANR